MGEHFELVQTLGPVKETFIRAFETRWHMLAAEVMT